MPDAVSRTALAAMIDHTLLAPTASEAEVESLVSEGLALGVGALCVSPSRVGLVAELLGATTGPTPSLASVCGFPSGAHRADLKAAEAAAAVAEGAVEVDVVANLAAIAERDWSLLAGEAAALRRAIGPQVMLKVILETAAQRPDALDMACRVVVGEGADLVKTSTGFHPAGGATLEAVAALATAVDGLRGGRGDAVGVKASGGIRTAADALGMVAAGATRIGASGTRAILDGLPENQGVQP
ncbi:MAG: deoxyribose-phosphate aldolase [Microthrixaceae bacterium]